MTIVTFLLAALAVSSPSEDLIGSYTVQDAITAHTLCSVEFQSDGSPASGTMVLPQGCDTLLHVASGLRWTPQPGGFRIEDGAHRSVGTVTNTPDGYALQLGTRRYRLTVISASLKAHSPQTQAVGSWRAFYNGADSDLLLCEMDFHPDGTIGLTSDCDARFRPFDRGRWQVAATGMTLRSARGTVLAFRWDENGDLRQPRGRLTMQADR